MWTVGWRDAAWKRLSEGKWDVAIVGGGITGAGILAEATRAGLRAVLVEGADFASGTSSRSSKLVHGGLRYLRNGQLRLTRESVKERERLMREAPGLVDALGFLLTTFEGDRTKPWMFGAGLAIYDVLARKWAHQKQDVKELIRRCPPLAGSPLKGGYHYLDAQTDDARLVLRVLREGVRRGGTAINYVRAKSLLRDRQKNVVGVTVEDASGGATRAAEIRAKVVINATGAWADELRGEVGAAPRLRRIRGSHLILPREKLPVPEAVTMLHPRDGRALFAIPWEGVTIVGTTDVDEGAHSEIDTAIAISEAEYIQEAVDRSFPKLGLGLDDVIATYAGVRGVVNTGKRNPSKESREHVLWNESGLLTVTGGKLTTFRLMARHALAALEDVLPDLEVSKNRDRILDEVPEVQWPAGLEPDEQRRLLGRHGEDVASVLAAREDLQRIGDTEAYWAELRWAARAEGVVHLDDLLLRRVRLGILLPNGAEDHMPRVRAIAQPELGWDDTRWTTEHERYTRLVRRAYSLQGARDATPHAAE